MFRGRGFLPEEDKPGAAHVAVMNHPLWQQAFGSDPNIVGQSLTLDGDSYTIVGLLPKGFQFGGTELDLYLPLAAPATRNPQGLSVSVGAYARLKPGVTLRAAQTDLDTISARLNQQYRAGIPRSARVWGVREFMVRDVQLSLWILTGAVGLVDLLPLSGSNSGTGFIPEGQPVPRPGEAPIVWLRFMSEGYFRAMSIPLLSGRQFDERDSPPAPPVAIVNRTLARRFWPGEDALGKRFTLGAPGPNVPTFTVVGVAGDLRHTNLIQEPDAELFLYYRQLSPTRVTVAVRIRSDPLRLSNTVRQALTAVGKDLPIARIQSMEQIVSDSISSRRLTMSLLGIFAAVALTLAGVGIYGVISYSVAQRRHEIGIRMALGAPRKRLLWMVTGQALSLALVGELVGITAMFALRRLIDSQLYGSTAMDPAIFAAVPLLLGAVAFVAALIPARRAMQVNPLIALRRE